MLRAWVFIGRVNINVRVMKKHRNHFVQSISNRYVRCRIVVTICVALGGFYHLIYVE